MAVTTRSLSWLVLVLTLAASGAGLLVRAQAPQPVNTWAPLGAVSDARSQAASVALPDGRIVIAGGRLADGTATDSVVLHDPVTNTFTPIGHLVQPRVDAAAALVSATQVIVAGGTIDGVVSADIELFDIGSGASILIGAMYHPRAGHAATRLASGQVFIVGGASTNGVTLASIEIFDPATGTSSPGGSLSTPRVGASATSLLHGAVLVAGGNNGTNDLASAEIYNPGGLVQPVPTAMSVARAGHTATLLPHNAGVLIAGGTAAGAAVSASDIFLPALFPDPITFGIGAFVPTGTLASPRSHAVGGPMGDNGYAFVLGGGAASAERFRFATIKTDKDDYAPGELALITGSGWQPGEAVKLIFQEDPAVHPDYVIDSDEAGNPLIVADGSGNISYNQWAPEEHDGGVRFYLMATGAQSQRRAQITFTDAANTKVIQAQTISPITATVTAILYDGTNTCTAGGGVTTTSLGSFALTSGTLTTITADNTNSRSLQLTAPANPTSPAGYSFTNWSSPTSGTATVVGGDPKVVCIQGTNGNQTDTFVPNYAPSNAAPVLTAIGSKTVDELVALTFTAAATDSDAPPQTLTFTLAGCAAGTFPTGAMISTGGAFSWTPTEAQGPGTYCAKVVVTDNGTPNLNDFEEVAITVGEANAAPDAVNDTATVDEDTADNVVAVLGNDTDPDNVSPTLPNAGLTVVAVGTASHGTVSLTAGVVKYTPTANYHGSDSFTYTVSDNGTLDAGHTDTATVNVTVTNVNDTPDAVNDTATVDEDTADNVVAVLGNDTDPDNVSPTLPNAGLTVVAVGTAGHGTVNLTAGVVKYTPTANYHGSDSFTYTVSDNGTSDAGHTDTATVNVTVTNVNDAPDAVNDTATVDEDTADNVVAVLGNDTDADNLTPPQNAGLTVVAVGTASHGTVTLTSGVVKFTPTANYHGSDSFTYTVSDDGTSDPGHTDTATVNVTVNNVNDPPDAVNDTATVDEDTADNVVAVLGNDTDADNLTPPLNAGLTVLAVGTASHGTVTLTSGVVKYTPTANYYGNDSFTYTVSDNGTSDPGHTDTATVYVTVNNVNDPPDAVNDTATVDEDTANNVVAVLSNDTDADNLAPPLNAGLTVLAVGTASHGTVTLTSGVVKYTPTANYYGNDSFTYTVSDNGTSDPGHTDTATVYVTVNNVNDPPDAVNDNATVNEDTLNNVVAVLGNDTDLDNLAPPLNAGLTVVAVGTASHGTVSLTAGVVKYTPTTNYYGSDSFTYTVSDNGTITAGHTDTATVYVTVVNVNDAPLVSNDGPKASTQYSDPIVPVTITASDIDSPLASLVVQSTSWRKTTDPSFTPGLPGSLAISGPTVGVSAVTWSLSGKMFVAAGSYVVRVTITDGVDTSYTDVTIEVTKEYVNLDYTGDSAKTISSGSVTFEMHAALTESDADYGTELDSVSVQFTLKDGSSTVGTCPSTVSTISQPPGKAVTTGCSITVPVSAATLYEVEMSLVPNPYYDGSGAGSAAAIIAVAGRTNGGFWFYEPLAGGGDGQRVNGGINATYQDAKKKTGAKGNTNVIRRAMFDLSTLHPSLPAGVKDYNFHVKSNATTQFTITCSGVAPNQTCTSTFTGKATVKAVDRATGISYNVGDALGGSVNFQVDVTDAGEPGSSPAVGPDKVAIRVWNAGSSILILDSEPNPTYTSTSQILINGGNIQVRP